MYTSILSPVYQAYGRVYKRICILYVAHFRGCTPQYLSCVSICRPFERVHNWIFRGCIHTYFSGVLVIYSRVKPLVYSQTIAPPPPPPTPQYHPNIIPEHVSHKYHGRTRTDADIFVFFIFWRFFWAHRSTGPNWSETQSQTAWVTPPPRIMIL